MTKKGYSLSFNRAQQLWLAKYKNSQDKWTQKRLPRDIGETQVLQAEAWFSNWLLSHQNGEAEPKIQPVKKTLKLLVPQWLAHRKASPGTKPNTYSGFVSVSKTWILDNPSYPHVSIENLDIEKELTVKVIRDWIESLRGEYGSRLTWIRTLKTCIKDAIIQEWLDPEMANPMEKPAIREIVKQMAEARADDKETITIPVEDWHKLLGEYTYKVSDMRKVRYLLSALTGLRDGESCGLLWKDLHLEEKIPYVKIERQLDRGGILPAVKYEDLVKDKWSKDQIKNSKFAIISNPKKKSKRIIPLHSALVKALKYWKEIGWKQEVGFQPTSEHPVFIKSLQNKKVGDVPGSYPDLSSSKVMKDDWERAKLEIGSITFHSWRRTFATMLNDLGVEESRVGVLLGHKAHTTAYQNYVKQNLPTLAETVQRLPVPRLLVLQKTLISLAENTPDPTLVQKLGSAEELQ